ncbi:MAG: ABC transporter permease [Chlamydiota bacterium]|nr:ABC transporter permease [Chlamydiota bacterium]
MIRLIAYSIIVACQMIWSKKMRSLLSIVGIIFGVATLIVTVSVAEGTRRQILKTIESFGENLVRIMPAASIEQEGNIHYESLHTSDFDSLSKTLQGVAGIGATLASAALIGYGKGDVVLGVYGVNAQYHVLRDLMVSKGRNFSEEEVHTRSRVCVIGADTANILGLRNLADNQEHWVYLWDLPYRVIGIFEKKGSDMGGNIDKLIFVPISTLQEVLGKPAEIQEIWLKASDGVATKTLIQQIRNYFLRSPIPRNDIDVWDQEMILAEKQKITKAFTIALGSIALIALIISGIGLMNMLLVSVAERIHEIGLRKAMGALPVDIMLQFLFEALLLCIVGTIGGIVVGLSLADSVSLLLNTYVKQSQLWQAHISFDVIAVALEFTFLVGLFFGLYPAWKASRMEPAEALTYH